MSNDGDCSLTGSKCDRKRAELKYDIPTLRIQAGTPLPIQQSPRQGGGGEGGGGGGEVKEEKLNSPSRLTKLDKSPTKVIH